jgi:hypothetical protein
MDETSKQHDKYTVVSLHAFARLLATYLPGWSYDVERSKDADGLQGLRCVAYLKNENNASFYLTHDSYRHKVTAYPETNAYHKNSSTQVTTNYGFEAKKRSCSEGASAVSFAKALKTHGVLDSACEARAQITMRLIDLDDNARYQAEAMEKLSAVPGVRVNGPSKYTKEACVYFEGGSATINGGSVYFKHLSVDADTAVRVLKALKGDV